MTNQPNFAAIADVDFEGADGQIDPKGKKVSTGIVLFEDAERIWIYEPRDHFGGYEHTFPKGRVEKGLTYQQNAHKELFEETGLLGVIKGSVGDFSGDTTITRYYWGIRTGGEPTCGAETQAVKLVTLAEAEPLLNRCRDKKVLETVVGLRPQLDRVAEP